MATRLVNSESGTACSVVASLSDDHFHSLITMTESVLLQLPESDILFPRDLIILPMQQFLSHLPFRERPAFLEPMIRIVLVLRHSQALPDTACVSFFLQRIQELSEQSVTDQGSIHCLHMMEMFSDLLMDMALHDISIIEQILPTPSPSSKQPRTVLLLPPETPLTLYSSLLQLSSLLLIHAEHGNEPFLSSESIQFLIDLKHALIMFFKERIIPILDFSSDQLQQQLNCSEHTLLCVCVNVCTTQLLDHEEDLRMCLYRSILTHTKRLMEKERRIEMEQGMKNLSVILYDGRSN